MKFTVPWHWLVVMLLQVRVVVPKEKNSLLPFVCLTTEWRTQMQAIYDVNLRDHENRQVYPFLERHYHHTSPNTSLVLQMKPWASHRLITWIASILLEEVIHYNVQHTSTNALLFNPSQKAFVDLEVWPHRKPGHLAKELLYLGPVGYMGRAGWYTTADVLKHVENLSEPQIYPEYWRDYKSKSTLIELFPSSSILHNQSVCPNATLDCDTQCVRTTACKASHKCVTIIATQAGSEAEYFEKVVENLTIPAMICYFESDQAKARIERHLRDHRAATFTHWEPDTLQVKHSQDLARIYLPSRNQLQQSTSWDHFSSDAKAPSTDFPVQILAKVGAKALEAQPELVHFFNKITFSPTEITQLLQQLNQIEEHNTTNASSSYHAACKWIRHSYKTWVSWIPPLPPCTENDLDYDLAGCNTTALREISFRWKNPSDQNASVPKNCDGGVMLPPQILSSRLCPHIRNDIVHFKQLPLKKPPCNRTFYRTNLSPCTIHSTRRVSYAWLYPDPTNATLSAECSGYEALPTSVVVDCHYIPFGSNESIAVGTAMVIVVACIIILTFCLFKYRKHPRIKRAQYGFLMFISFGAIINCLCILIYIGPVSPHQCLLGPIGLSMGFVTMFGSLLVRSYRVYRVFTATSTARHNVSSNLMRLLFLLLILIDLAILAIWFLSDLPVPMNYDKLVPRVGFVQYSTCRSRSNKYFAGSIIWKVVLLITGACLSIRIRFVDTDFQDAAWISMSTITVILGSFFAFPVLFLFEMPQTSRFLIAAFALLMSNALVVSFMTIPKLWNIESKSVAPVRHSTNLAEQMNMISIRSSRNKANRASVFTKAVRDANTASRRDLRLKK